MNLHQLVKEAKQGSSAAQKCLYDAFSGGMLLVCCRYVKDRQDAEELMLNGFYKFFTSLHSFQYHSDAGLYGWVKKIMINECLMFLRKTNLLLIATESVADEVQLQEEALNNLSAAEIFRYITQLPPGYRIVFNLYEIDGFSHKEIAKQLDITEGTSKSQLSKAKKMLQKVISQNQETYGTKKSN